MATALRLHTHPGFVPDADSPLDPKSPTYLNREEVLASLGYKSESKSPRKTPKLQPPPGVQADLCHRCGKKVYPVEKLDIGVLYHRGCFKCRACGMQLTLRNFQREVEPGSSKTKEVYCQAHVPKLANVNIGLDALGIRSPMDAQKIARVQHQHDVHEHHYDQSALEFQHSSEIKRRKKVKRRSTLKSFQDFEKFGVFDAQSALEKVHREEEDELYRQMFEERKLQTNQLEKSLKEEKKKTVKELISWFETQKTPPREREAGLAKVEQYFKQMRGERSQLLLQRLAAEEQAAISRLIEKQSQEMLNMIANKEKEATLTLKREKRKSQIAKEDGKMMVRPDDASTKTGSSVGTKSSGSGSARSRTSHSSSGQRTEIRTAGATITVVASDRNVSVSSQKFHPTITRSQEIPQQPRTSSSRSQEIPQPRAAVSRSQEIPQNRREQADRQQQNRRQGSTNSLKQGRQPAHPLSQGSNQGARQGSKSSIIDPGRRSMVGGRPEAQPRVAGRGPGAAGPGKENVHENVQPSRRRKNSYENAMNDDQAVAPVKIVPPTLQFLPPGAAASGPASPTEASTAWDDSSSSSEGVYEIEDIENVMNEKRANRRRQQRGKSAPVVSQAKPKLQPARRQESSASGSETDSEGNSSEYTDETDDDDVRSTVSVQPAIVPPKTSKATLHATPEVFKELDLQAIEETKRDHHTFTDLVRHLSKRCQTELQRVRAIFRWVTAKDLNKVRFTQTMAADSPMGLLRGIKYGTETYHNLFKRLCSYAGLHCEVIEGYSKGAGYRPGTKFKGNVFRNQWTAVSVGDSWRFINCNWGARHLKGRKDEVLTYKCDEFYFLTDPEDHIYQHFPDDSTWQLLKKPITMGEFIRLPVVKSPFFNNKLSFYMKYNSIIQASDGTAEIRLTTPRILGFAAKLKSRDGQVPNEIIAERTCIRQMGKEAVVMVNLPTPGKYVLDIFVSHQWTSDTMDNACSFQIYCTGVSQQAHLSYPQVGTFGRTPAFVHHGLAERSHGDPYIQASGRQVIRFATSTEVKLNHNLRYWNHRDRRQEDMDRHALIVHRDNNLVTYLLLCPRRGHYTFSLFSGKPDSDISNMDCVYRYLIECRAPPDHPHPMPKASKRWRHCELIEPLSGVLSTRSRVRFRVRSAAAVEVVLCLHGTWMTFSKGPDAVWQGTFHMGDKDAKAMIYGRFDSRKEKYIPLLEYQVKTPNMSDENKMLYKYL